MFPEYPLSLGILSMSMLSMSQLQVDLLAAFAGLLLCYLYSTRKRVIHPPFPPGPKGVPFIGNLLDLPKEKAWETYSRWGKEYGNVVHIAFAGTSIIILNSFKDAYELLQRRSSIYSSRPYSTMLNELMDFGRGTVLQPYGSQWRKHRLHYHKQLNPVAVQGYHVQQTIASKEFLRHLLKNPEDYLQHIRNMSASVVMEIAYGRDVLPKADPYVAISERNVRFFAQATRPGAFLVDSIPILKHVPAWFPGANFKKFAREARNSMHLGRDMPFRDVKAQLASGTARPSFVARALTELGTDDESNYDVEIIKSVAGGIFTAGSDTTTSALHSFILAMILYPEVQKKGQAELDRVLGKGRLPQFTNRPDLPYIEAIVKEVFRWMPVTRTGLPHVTTEDDVYQGYYIPANSVIFANVWNILHDPDMYPNPSVFLPERFFPDQDGNVPRSPTTGGAFGFGRRICAGRHLAESAVWIAVASMLSAFDFTNALDERGNKIDVTYACEPAPGTLSHPRVFQCLISPRSEEAEALIRKMDT